jgi:hypothetical protein
MFSFSVGHQLPSDVTSQPRRKHPSYQWTMVLGVHEHNLYIEINQIEKSSGGGN